MLDNIVAFIVAGYLVTQSFPGNPLHFDAEIRSHSIRWSPEWERQFHLLAASVERVVKKTIVPDTVIPCYVERSNAKKR